MSNTTDSTAKFSKSISGGGTSIPNLDLTVKFAKLTPDAKIPKQVPGSAGLDFYACFDEPFMKVPAHGSALVPTGVKMLLPEGYFVWLEDRGSTGSKGIKRSAGIMDNDYRGEVIMMISNLRDYDYYIYKNDYDSIQKMYEAYKEEKELELKAMNPIKRFIEKIKRKFKKNKCFDVTKDGRVFAMYETDEVHFYPYEKAIFQGIVLYQFKVESEEISLEEYEKNQTSRGEGKLGSSGK